MKHQFTHEEIKQILEAFSTLGIKPTTNLVNIKKAFRQLAKHYHPDTTTDPMKKMELEKKFKELVNHRDVALDSTVVDNMLEQLSDFIIHFEKNVSQPQNQVNISTTYQTSNQKSTSMEEQWNNPHNKSNEEWTQFVDNPNDYFNKLNASTASISLFFISVFSTILIFTYSLIISAVVAIIAVIGLIIFAVVTIFSISIPVAGWLFGIHLIIALSKSDPLAPMTNYYMYTVVEPCFRILSKTSYPLKIFFWNWAIPNILLGICWLICFLYLKYGLNPEQGLSLLNEHERNPRILQQLSLFLALFHNVFYAFLYGNVISRLKQIDSAFEKLRNTYNTALIKTRSESRFKND